MKLRDLAKLTLIGIGATLLSGASESPTLDVQNESPDQLIANHECGAKCSGGESDSSGLSAAEPMDARVSPFYRSLSHDAKQKFEKLSPQQRERAMQRGGDANQAVEAEYGARRGAPTN